MKDEGGKTKYRAPRGVKLGDRLQSLVGERIVTHLVPTAIGPWPASDLDDEGRHVGGRPTPILYGDLREALTELTVAEVSAIWGYGRKSVARWAKLAGVDTVRGPVRAARRRALAAAGIALPGDARKKGGLVAKKRKAKK